MAVLTIEIVLLPKGLYLLRFFFGFCIYILKKCNYVLSEGAQTSGPAVRAVVVRGDTF